MERNSSSIQCLTRGVVRNKRESVPEHVFNKSLLVRSIQHNCFKIHTALQICVRLSPIWGLICDYQETFFGFSSFVICSDSIILFVCLLKQCNEVINFRFMRHFFCCSFSFPRYISKLAIALDRWLRCFKRMVIRMGLRRIRHCFLCSFSGMFLFLSGGGIRSKSLSHGFTTWI